jgi:hypothetical protein
MSCPHVAAAPGAEAVRARPVVDRTAHGHHAGPHPGPQPLGAQPAGERAHVALERALLEQHAGRGDGGVSSRRRGRAAGHGDGRGKQDKGQREQARDVLDRHGCGHLRRESRTPRAAPAALRQGSGRSGGG